MQNMYKCSDYNVAKLQRYSNVNIDVVIENAKQTLGISYNLVKGYLISLKYNYMTNISRIMANI